MSDRELEIIEVLDRACDARNRPSYGDRKGDWMPLTHAQMAAAIRAHEAHKACGGFNWQSAFHKEHDDFCKVEARNYVLKTALREIDNRIQFSSMINMDLLDDVRAIARKALGEE